jgi:acyl-CoA synthetase (AMP-forming)/AMP-acid ligase II
MNTVRSIIDARAESQPETVFQIAPEPGLELTYAGLQSIGHMLNDRLGSIGVARGDKVAFLLDNGHWTTALFLGVMYAGRVILPLNAVAGPDQLSYILSHSDAKALFISGFYNEKFSSVLGNLSGNVLLIETDEDTGPTWPQDAEPAAALPALAPEDEALLIYTSGTTGLPKGVILTHRNVIAGGENTAGAHELTNKDRALCVLPLYHINGEMVTVIAPLVSNGRVVMPHRFSAKRFWHWVSDHQCTWFSVVPTIISYLIEHDEREAPDHDYRKIRGHVRFGRSASSALAPAIHRAFEDRFGIRVVETMGLTETAAQILSNPLPPGKMKYGSPGQPYGNQAKIVNKQGEDAKNGEKGELLIQGDNVMKGYYKNPEATQSAIDADGWFHTGDIAYRDEDEFYFITGRLKELIIKGGENIAPREIDDVLYKHPAVLEAAAFGMPDDNYGEEVMACVAFKPGETCSSDELQAFCVDNLGKYKAPKAIYVLRNLPKGPSGKIQRLKLVDIIADMK